MAEEQAISKLRLVLNIVLRKQNAIIWYIITKDRNWQLRKYSFENLLIFFEVILLGMSILI